MERGFSVNKECLMDNMKEESLVGIRTVYDAVKYQGEVGKVSVTKSMILSVRNSYGRYKDVSENQKEKTKWLLTLKAESVTNYW